MVLDEAREKGLDKVMLDCAVNNLASDKTIKDLGGVIERCEVDQYDKELTNVYWIDVNESLEKYKEIYEPYIAKDKMKK